jgi:hypothetical protein
MNLVCIDANYLVRLKNFIEEAVLRIALGNVLYEGYTRDGMPFASWNDPSTTNDETFGTFMTLAYRFCWHAEDSRRGYREPVKHNDAATPDIRYGNGGSIRTATQYP